MRENKSGRGEKGLVALLIVLIILVMAATAGMLWLCFGENKGGEESGYGKTEGEERAVLESETETTTEDPEAALYRKAGEILSEMTLEEKVNQLFFITPEALTGVGVATRAGDATKQALMEHPVGGLIYFSANFENEEQIKEMLENTKEMGMEACKVPLFLGVDEEGGTVARLGSVENLNIPTIPDMKEMGESKDLNKAYEAGETIGAYLSDYGFNLDFAPVADVLTNPENTVVKDRSFGSDPQLVSDMAKEVSRGLNDRGILSCYKHFPGHGATKDDTHEGFAYTEKTLTEIKESELVPFDEAVKNGADLIMVGHISLPGVVGDNTPASISPAIVTDLLQKELGFKGIVITDSLSMGALTDLYSADTIAVKAIEAGADMLLMPEDFNLAYNGVLNAVNDGTISEDRLDASVLKIIKLKLCKLSDDIKAE